MAIVVTGASSSFGRAAAQLLQRLPPAQLTAIVRLDHRATEELPEAAGIAWTFLRDSQYAEAIAGAMVPPALMVGRMP